MPVTRTLLLFILLGCAHMAMATHNRAGEIIVCRIGDQGYIYQISMDVVDLLQSGKQ